MRLSLLPTLSLVLTIACLLCSPGGVYGGRVAVDVFVMSKCPDAITCTQVFYPALAQVSTIIDLNYVYIAKESPPGVFKCLHGEPECQGDRQQLCAHRYAPQQTQIGVAPKWLDFIACQSNSSYLIPNNMRDCATQTGFDPTQIDQCASGSEGATLLHNSIQLIRNANESISCTINLNQDFWCQHNGDWVGCTEGNDSKALVKSVCKRYQGPDKPGVCGCMDGNCDKPGHRRDRRRRVAIKRVGE